jgi:hypothetical protein
MVADYTVSFYFQWFSAIMLIVAGKYRAAANRLNISGVGQ